MSDIMLPDFILNIAKLPEFKNNITENDILNFFNEHKDFIKLLTLADFQGDEKLLQKKFYSTIASNIISYLKNNIDTIHQNDKSHQINTSLKYFNLLNSIYGKYKNALYLKPYPLCLEEEALFNNITNLLLPNISPIYEFIHNQSFGDFPNILNHAINSINTLDLEELDIDAQLDLIDTQKRYHALFIKFFDTKMSFHTLTEKQNKVNDFFIEMSSFQNITNFSSISSHIGKKLNQNKSDFQKHSLSFNSHNQIIDDNTIITRISFPSETPEFKTIYKDIYLYLEKLIKPKNIHLAVSYEKSAKNILNDISFSSKEKKELHIVIMCDKNYSPFFSNFILQKVNELGNLFFDLHTNDVVNKDRLFINFAKNLINEERELYLNYLLAQSSPDKKENRTKHKI